MGVGTPGGMKNWGKIKDILTILIIPVAVFLGTVYRDIGVQEGRIDDNEEDIVEIKQDDIAEMKQEIISIRGKLERIGDHSVSLAKLEERSTSILTLVEKMERKFDAKFGTM